jgi:hypothetical protein
MLDQIGQHLICLAVTNRKDCRFVVYNHNENAKDIGDQSEEYLSLHFVTWALPIATFIIEPTVLST